jgi:hypothetical protein
MALRPSCKFTFDDEKTYEGFDLGSTWNGFDNVAVSREVLDELIKDFDFDPDNPDQNSDDFRALLKHPMANGLYSLANGYATMIVRKE